MIRRVGLIRRHFGSSPEEFFRYWIEEHAELVRQLEGLRGYRINRIVDASPGCTWDGLGELWFDSVSAAEESVSRLARPIDEDLGRFVGDRITFYSEEHVILPPPR
jgi:uncharacterized protein (TIGR02118 family)